MPENESQFCACKNVNGICNFSKGKNTVTGSDGVDFHTVVICTVLQKDTTLGIDENRVFR